MALIDDVKKLIGKRTDMVDDLVAALEKQIGLTQRQLFDSLTEAILDNLDTENGRIKNTARNRQLMAQVDKVFNAMETTSQLDVAKEIVRGTGELLGVNASYFTLFTNKTQLIPISEAVKDNVSAWLGLGERGALEENGYLKTLITDTQVRNQVKSITISAVLTQQGYDSFRTGLSDFIKGSPDKLGALQKYYRNYAYDTYSQIDRSAADLYAQKLKMDFAIYEGGLIATSRAFCKEKNGKVFTREEIMKFNPTEAKQPNYNPIRDLGGYGCRHHLNWIPFALAVLLRPDLEKYRDAA